MRIHIVKKGDTLYELAKKYHVDLNKLIEANPIIANPDQLQVGLKVKIPAASQPVLPPNDKVAHKHIVVQGDTLWKLSKTWDVPLQAIIEANPHLKNPNVLLTGEVVYIPKLGTPHALPNQTGQPNPINEPTSMANPALNETLSPALNPAPNPVLSPALNPAPNPVLSPALNPAPNPALSPAMNLAPYSALNPAMNSEPNPVFHANPLIGPINVNYSMPIHESAKTNLAPAMHAPAPVEKPNKAMPPAYSSHPSAVHPFYTYTYPAMEAAAQMNANMYSSVNPMENISANVSENVNANIGPLANANVPIGMVSADHAYNPLGANYEGYIQPNPYGYANNNMWNPAMQQSYVTPYMNPFASPHSMSAGDCGCGNPSPSSLPYAKPERSGDAGEGTSGETAEAKIKQALPGPRSGKKKSVSQKLRDLNRGTHRKHTSRSRGKKTSWDGI